MSKIIVLIYLSGINIWRNKFAFLCKTRAPKYKCLSVHQSVFHTVVCHQNLNLNIFQTVGGKAFILMAVMVIVTSYSQYNNINIAAV